MHLLIPMAASDEPACGPLLCNLQLPHLAQLVTRLAPLPIQRLDHDEPATPDEPVLARALGLAEHSPTPWAALRAHELGLADASHQAWAFITPCHWLLGQAQVTLSEPAELALPDDESRALLAAMQPYFAEDGLTLVYEQPQRWLASGEVFRALRCASPARVIGRDVKAWLPPAPPLVRLQTEMQMLLYRHPVNEARSAQGRTPVNAFWVSGCGVLSHTPPASQPAPVVVRTLERPARAGDWAAWSQAWQALDAHEGAALLAASQRGEEVQLTLCGERSAQTLRAAPRGLLQRASRLWRRPSLLKILEAL
jgi:hypothetical protein